MPTLALMQNWRDRGSFEIQFSILIILTTFIYILYSNNKKFLSILILTFFIFTVSNAYFVNFEKLAINTNKKNVKYNLEKNTKEILNIISNSPIKKKHDVILLVSESYVNQKTMRYYGFDNDNQLLFLEENGFTIYHDNYTLGPSTRMSLTRMLNITSDLEYNSAEYLAGNNFVADALSKAGYQTIAIYYTDDFYRKVNPVWDQLIPKRNLEPFDLLKAVAEVSSDMILKEKLLKNLNMKII